MLAGVRAVQPQEDEPGDEGAHHVEAQEHPERVGRRFRVADVGGAQHDVDEHPAQGTDGTVSLRLYFSYVTLATLGYGDYTAAGDLGHTLAIVEALFGQLYLVTVVAVLVSRLGIVHRQH